MVTEYGFVWGPVEVARLMSLADGRRALEVKTPYRRIEVYVSPTGRSVRVFCQGREMVIQ